MIIKEIKLLTQIRAVQFIAKTVFKKKSYKCYSRDLSSSEIYEQHLPQTTRRVSSNEVVDWRETDI